MAHVTKLWADDQGWNSAIPACGGQAFQSAEQGPVVMALAHADFIGAKHRDAVQGPLCLHLRQGLRVAG